MVTIEQSQCILVVAEAKFSKLNGQVRISKPNFAVPFFFDCTSRTIGMSQSDILANKMGFQTLNSSESSCNSSLSDFFEALRE